jgi:HSP20 family protein
MTMLTEQYAPWLRDLNRLFTSEGAVAGFIPPADVIVGDDGVMVYMDVPGLNADSVEIELENDVLTVRGERRFPYAEDGGRSVRRIERRFGRFERSLRVPRGLDPDAVQAELADGVLMLRIPKPESQKPHRVPVRPGTSQSQPQQGQAGAGSSSPQELEGSRA